MEALIALSMIANSCCCVLQVPVCMYVSIVSVAKEWQLLDSFGESSQLFSNGQYLQFGPVRNKSYGLVTRKK
jgi:hypothetical protein